MQKKSGLIVTILISGVAVVISYAINFVLTPFITNSIGVEAYGFVSIAKTMVNYAGILTIALTSFVVRYISVAYFERRLEDAKSYYTSSLAATGVLTAGILVIALGMISKLEFLLNIPENLISQVKLLFLFVFINFAVTTITTPVSSAAYIRNRLDLNGYIKIIAYILDALILVGLFSLLRPKLWYVGIGSLVAGTATFLCSYVLLKRLTPELRFEKKRIDIGKIKEILKNGIWNSVNALGNTLNSGLDLLISNLMLSGTQTGQIAVVKTLGSMFSLLYQTVFPPFQPRLIKAYAAGNKQAFEKELTGAMKLCGYFSNIAFAGFCSLGMLYYKLWLPEQDTALLYEMTVLMNIESITAGIMQPVYYVYTLTVKTKLPCWITIGGGLLNLLAKFLLLKYTNLGPYAVVGTTMIVMLCINIFFNPIYSAKCLNTSAKIFYKVMIKYAISCVAVCVAAFLIVHLLKPTGWIGLLGAALVICAIGVVIHTGIMYKREDLNEIVQKISRCARRSNKS